MISSVLTVNTVEDGTSPYLVDLTNQMDAVACNPDGTTISSEQSVATNVNFFLGNTKQSITNIVCTMGNGQYTLGTTYASGSGLNAYFRAVVTNLNTTSPTVTIYVKAGTDVDTPKKVNIAATAASQTLAKDMTISGVAGGESAVIYQLLPQVSDVSVGRDSSNELTPRYNSVRMGYKKTTGGESTSVSDATGFIDGRMTIYFKRRQRSNGVMENTYHCYQVEADRRLIVIDAQTSGSGLDVRTYDQVEFYLYETTDTDRTSFTFVTLHDRETIPVVSDGEQGEQGAKGDDAPTALASPDKISIPCNTNGSVTAQVTKTLTFSMRVGSYAASNIRVTPPSTFPTGVSYSESSGTLTIGTSATASGISSGVTFTVIGAYNNKDYTATVTVALIGAGTGQRGKMGRMYYYDDKWSSSKTYTSTDSQAPYVLASNGEFYMLDNAGNGGSNVTSTNQDPTNSTYGNGKPWTIMYSDQKYYIAEAVFSNFAKLGSGVFSKDWMLSQYGYHSQEILSSSQSISSAIGTWNQIPNQLAAISTTKGMEYTILIEGKATSSNQVQVRVFYKPTGSSTYNYQGRDFYAITSTTSTQYVFSFKAEYDGQVTFYASGYGTISKIINTQQGDYTNFSPSFPNADTVNIPMYAGIPTNTWRIPNQNTYYLVADNLYTFTAYSPAASGVITIEVFNADSESTPKLHSSTFTIASNASSGTLSFRPSVSCNAGIRAKTTSGSTNRSINNINIKPDNPFIPMVAVDWFSGYAHFGGDKIRFNPDGSGFVAGGKFYWDSLGNGSIAEDNINWDTEGNVTISGTIYAEDGEFNGTVHANDGDFKGTITTVSLYQQYQDLSETQTLDISKGTYVIAEAVPDAYSSIVITIPSASNSRQVTLTIVSPVADSNPNSGYNFPKIQSTVGGFYTKKSHSGSYRIRSFKTSANVVVKLHSIGNSWFLDTEEDYLTDVTAW